MRVFRYVLLLLLFSPIFSYGGMQDYANDYLKDMESRNATAFYSRCKSKADGRYMATLIFEVGSTKGLLIETRNRVVVNLATVIIGPKGLTIEETHGGIYTYERVKKLAEELVRYKFNILMPVREKVLESDIPSDTCVNE